MEYFMLDTQISIKALVKKSAFTTQRKEGCWNVCNAPVLVLGMDLVAERCNQDATSK